MADLEQFLTGNDDSTSVSKFCGKNLKPVLPSTHLSTCIDKARRPTTPVEPFHDAVEMVSSNEGGQLRDVLPEVTKLVKISLATPVTSCT